MSATAASMHLTQNDAILKRSISRLSSGKKIVSSADDAGGLAVSSKLNSTLLRNVRVRETLNNSLSFLQTQAGALKVVGDVLTRMSELKTMSLDISKNEQDYDNYNKEFKELQSQLHQISRQKFNGISLFSDQMPKTLFGDSLNMEILHPLADENDSKEVTNVTRWGIYRNLSQRLEAGDKTPTGFGDDPPREFLSMVFTNESLSNEEDPTDNDTPEPRRSYHEHYHGGYDPSRPLGEDHEDQYWIQDRDDWIGYLGSNNFSAKMGVVTNGNSALIPDHYNGGGIISESTKAEIAKDGLAVDFFQNNSAGGDGLLLEARGGTAASQLANFQNAFHKLTNNGTELPHTLVLNVDNSGSMGGFKELNEGILDFKDWVKNTYPQVYVPDQTSANFQKYIDPVNSMQNGVSIASNENGYFMGIRINEGEDYIRQGRLAIEDARVEFEASGGEIPGTLDNDKSGVKGLLDDIYDLADFDMSELVEFEQKLSEALAVNGSESSRAEYELGELTKKSEQMELAYSRIVDADFAAETTRMAKHQILTQSSARMVSEAVRLTDVVKKVMGDALGF